MPKVVMMVEKQLTIANINPSWWMDNSVEVNKKTSNNIKGLKTVNGGTTSKKTANNSSSQKMT